MTTSGQDGAYSGYSPRQEDFGEVKLYVSNWQHVFFSEAVREVLETFLYGDKDLKYIDIKQDVQKRLAEPTNRCQRGSPIRVLDWLLLTSIATLVSMEEVQQNVRHPTFSGAFWQLMIKRQKCFGASPFP